MSDIDRIRILEEELKFPFEQNPNFGLGCKKKANFAIENNYVKKLQLYKFNLIRIPESIGAFSNLEYLEIAYCSLESISNLDSLIGLKELYLQGNKIGKISGLNYLNSLEKLDLSNNKIERIENMKSLNNLKSLELSYNKIRIIEDIKNLNLNHLGLSNNLIRSFPDNFTGFNELKLSNNQLTTYSIMLLNSLKSKKKITF